MNDNAFSKITYGLFVITSADGQQKTGYICNTVMQVSAFPLYLLITSNKGNYTTELILNSRKLAISVLGKSAPMELIALFGYRSGRNIDKFANVDYFEKDGLPIVTSHTLAWFDCEMVQEIDIGTHLLFLCQINNAEVIDNEEEPMTYTYFRNVLKGKSPEAAPTYIQPLNKNLKKEEKMNYDIYSCDVCGYEYDPAIGDPDNGIAPGTTFENLPDTWTCPLCGVDKSDFSIV